MLKDQLMHLQGQSKFFQMNKHFSWLWQMLTFMCQSLNGIQAYKIMRFIQKN